MSRFNAEPTLSSPQDRLECTLRSGQRAHAEYAGVRRSPTNSPRYISRKDRSSVVSCPLLRGSRLVFDHSYLRSISPGTLGCTRALGALRSGA
jgi:hypothetical protein